MNLTHAYLRRQLLIRNALKGCLVKCDECESMRNRSWNRVTETFVDGRLIGRLIPLQVGYYSIDICLKCNNTRKVKPDIAKMSTQEITNLINSYLEAKEKLINKSSKQTKKPWIRSQVRNDPRYK